MSEASAKTNASWECCSAGAPKPCAGWPEGTLLGSQDQGSGGKAWGRHQQGREGQEGQEEEGRELRKNANAIERVDARHFAGRRVRKELNKCH